MRTLFALSLVFLLLWAFASAATAQQPARPGPGCVGGGDEADRLHNLGINYSHGLRGMPRDIDKAAKCYEEAVNLGSPRSAINLGLHLRLAYADIPQTRAERFERMNRWFQKAIDMGCPDAYYHLGYSYEKGWGVPQNKRKARELIKKGVDAGSYACMAAWGMIQNFDEKPEEAKIWLHRALDGGYGLAAEPLSLIYFKEGDLEKEIQVLRQGAKLGDKMSLIGLSLIYKEGTRQPKDMEHADCFKNIANEIDSRLAPPIIQDLDERCPHAALGRKPSASILSRR